MFLLLTYKEQWKTKDYASKIIIYNSSTIISNPSLYFENLGTAISKEHLSVAVSVTKNFHGNLPFLF